MPKIHCPDCSRDIGMHELEGKTTTVRSGGFSTRYRCPFCRTDMDNITDYLV